MLHSRAARNTAGMTSGSLASAGTVHYCADMRTHTLLALPLLVLTALPASAADSPQALLRRMKAWLEPKQPSTRQLAMTIRSGTETAQWTAAQARGSVDGANYVLTVLLSPADVRGTASLIKEETGKPTLEWIYLPSLRRVRQIIPVNEFDAFLNTEFTYADFGFVNVGDRTLKTLDPKAVSGVAGVQVQETPNDQRTFRRIVSTVVPETGQPLQREYYSPANRLWKVETFEDVAEIHGVPTVQRVRMEDVQTGYGSEYRAGQIAYGVTIPKELFDPGQLSRAADSPLWR
jgi:Outer membrane lipoprotein-sorting protein